MALQIEPPKVSTPLLSAGYRSLLIMAILAGMASAAAFVFIDALHTWRGPLQPGLASASKPSPRPSAFGAAIAATSSRDVALTPSQIAAGANSSIVTVTGYDRNDRPITHGSGYVYSSSGIIVTSYGAIRGASSVTIDASSGEELNVIAVMGYSPSRDLAVLAVLEGNLPALETGPAEVVQEGDAIVVVGPDKSITQSLVGSRRAIEGVDLLSISTPAAAGSPVLNDHARVIAVTTHKRAGPNATLAVPTRYISDLLAEHRVLSFDQVAQETGPEL